MPFKTYGSIRFYTRRSSILESISALVSEIECNGFHIFKKTRALKIEGDESITITTDRGAIRANKVIQATHFPINDNPGLIFQCLYQSRSYVLGVRIRDPFPQGMFNNAKEPESAESLFSQIAEAAKGLVDERIIPTHEKALEITKGGCCRQNRKRENSSL